MLEAVNLLISILNDELGNTTGIIKKDRENGSFEKVRKLVSAIRVLSDDPANPIVSMEFQRETWQVIIHNNIIQFKQAKIG